MNEEREHLSDPIDVATNNSMMAVEVAIKEVSSRARRQQERRVDGTYEFLFCESCDLKIEEGRLDAAPMNLLCVFCASKRERRWM